jgi:hypothetical protein
MVNFPRLLLQWRVVLEDAMKAKDQIAALSSNLGKLNQLYGNMLTAMQAR